MSPEYGAISAKIDNLLPADDITSDIVCEGWMLKKRRKKMQGINLNTIQSLEFSLQNLVLETSSLSKKSHGLGKKFDKDKTKDPTKEPKFSFFKRSSNHSSPSRPSEFGLDATVLDAVPDPLHSSFHRLQLALETLKTQHTMLVTSMQALTEINQANQGSPLPTTVEESSSTFHNSSPQLSTSVSRLSKRASVLTSGSGSMQEWFDALDGAEEFLLDVPTPEEKPSGMFVDENRSSLNQEDTSSVDTDVQELDKKRHPAPMSIASPPESLRVKRRTRLPSPPVNDEGSLFAILKRNVGKVKVFICDLSTITFPVTFNEPLTLLQRAAEEVEYHSVLDDAARADTILTQDIGPGGKPCKYQLRCSSTRRHPLTPKWISNPMLGETFEDARMKFIAEKVRHNPLEIAYHAEGRNWALNATSSGRTKFWGTRRHNTLPNCFRVLFLVGKSLEIIPLGTTRLTIDKDHYVWFVQYCHFLHTSLSRHKRNKPSSFVRNIMVGTKYLEHTGQMTIENTHDQTRCVLDFKPNGYWGPSNVVTGVVYGPQGDIVMHLEGKWDDQMTQTLDSSNFRVLWRSTPFPKNAQEFYGFTSFGITLNELTDDLFGKIPPTDSRLRPDVRALEEGDTDEAEAQKSTVEEMQRERRKRGKDRHPRWFEQKGDEWIYVGGYWEAREQGWKGEDIQTLW
ncbi:hypothetical protein C0993_004940 [Termitomyces sp. T159_Od127]|nr:hypothetical protein C0993_004940 [Termitomyces sp. T159_Od127]